ncbi:MAG: hypothetical protein ACP5F3_05600 [Candidatus Syntrophosphaera sp.]
MAAKKDLAWLERKDLRAIAIAGICKNAGKTTLLNHILEQHDELDWGVFSTGIDGEETDQVFRIPKPRVKLGSGTIFCCDTPNLDGHGSSVSVLAELAQGSSYRPLWLTRTEVPIQTEITGPASVREQIEVLEKMHALGADKVLIDGSLDRKSIAMSEAVDAVTILIGASFGPLNEIREEIKRLETLNRLEKYQPSGKESQDVSKLLASETIWITRGKSWYRTELATLIGTKTELQDLLGSDPARIYIPGGLTDPVLAKIKAPLLESKAQIILRHPDCLKLSLPKLERFMQDFNPKVLVPFKIRSYYLNTASIGRQAVDAEDLRQKLRGDFPGLGLVDIRELEK